MYYRLVCALLCSFSLCALSFEAGPNGGMLAIDEDAIYVVVPLQGGDQLSCFDKQGNLIWDVPFRGAILCCTADAQNIFVFSKEQEQPYLTCVDRYTGTVIWDR